MQTKCDILPTYIIQQRKKKFFGSKCGYTDVLTLISQLFKNRYCIFGIYHPLLMTGQLMYMVVLKFSFQFLSIQGFIIILAIQKLFNPIYNENFANKRHFTRISLCTLQKRYKFVVLFVKIDTSNRNFLNLKGLSHDKNKRGTKNENRISVQMMNFAECNFISQEIQWSR